MWYYCLEVLCDPSRRPHPTGAFLYGGRARGLCIQVSCKVSAHPRNVHASAFIDDDTPLHFFYFCMDLSYKPAVFVSFFGGLPARNTLKSRCSS